MNSLAPGDRIGPYEVRASLGAGGMGEVYRAHDTTLGREVALKVLTDRFAGDAGRLTRLDREARILASLNHPNIATIHGMVPSDAGPALVLELVEGPTLEDRLAPGALPLDETLHYARQIAEALEAAHEQGIVHRDLKPGNIKIRPDGTVKVLDFGIAKILDADQRAGPGATTVTSTGEGVLIGTTHYMSPEQARGTEVTRRSDVWAFGTILFEMLAGKRAFSGSTKSDVLAAILQSSPDWSALPASTPPGIVRLVRRCLERDPKARLHDIGDARLEIEDEERALRGEAPIHTGRSARSGRWGRPSWMFGFAAIVAVAVLGALAYRFSLRGSEEPRQEVRLQMPPPSGTRFVGVPAVSRDGRHLVFAAASEGTDTARLWLRPLSASGATELEGTEGASYPFWSPDGRSVAFFAGGLLKRMNVASGGPIVICEAAVGRGGLWLEDGSIVLAPSQFSPLMRVNAAGGQPAPLTSLADDETGHRFPQSLPGRRVLYFATNRTPDKSGTRLISLDAPEHTINFFPGITAAGYVAGFMVFALQPYGSTLVAQQLSLPDGQLLGEPIEVGRARISETFGRNVVSTAPGGVIAFLGPAGATGHLTWMSRDGRVLETVGNAEAQLGVELSPDGQRLATVRGADIWMLDPARPVPTRATRGRNLHPIWSPDGTRIASVYQGRGIGTFDLEVTSVSTGSFTTVLQATYNVKPLGWTPDGKTLIFNRTVDKTLARPIWTVEIDEPRRANPYLADAAQNLEGRLSPDGKWMAYSTDQSGRFEIEVRGFPAAGARYPVSLEGGGYPRWRADGRELYYVSANSRLIAVTVAPGDPPRFGKPEPLFEVKLVAHPDRANFAEYEYDVSADGSRFLVNRMVSPPETSMSVIVDWNPPR
jgi:Tol biopolymer transport system component